MRRPHRPPSGTPQGILPGWSLTSTQIAQSRRCSPRRKNHPTAFLQQTLVILWLATLAGLSPASQCSARKVTAPARRPLRIAPAASTHGPEPRAAVARRKPARGVPRPAPAYSPNNLLKYFKGPLVVAAPTPLHVIYYGSWKNGTQALTDPAQTIIRSFLLSLNATTPNDTRSVAKWWQINSLYTDKNGTFATNQVYLASEQYDWYSRGSNLADESNEVFHVIKRQFALKRIAASSAAMYAVLTSSDVVVGARPTGFCFRYCGFHDTQAYKAPGSKTKTSIYYAFVGNPETQCPWACRMNFLTPNGNQSVDSMVDTLAHELAEIATDPDTMTGWLTDQGSSGQENADLCWRNYVASVVPAGKAYRYNLVGLNGTKFLVQANYDPVQAACAISP